MRPQISDFRRRIARLSPIARVGIPFDSNEQRAIQHLLELSNTAGAQRMIIDKLVRAFRGPRTRATMRPGDRRKRLVKV